MTHSGLIADLSRLIGGAVTDAPDAIGEVSTDFGQFVHKRPRAVVRPENASDVARVIKYAYDRDLAISPRAGGNSFGGQSLNEGGVVIDMRAMRALDSINAEAGWFEADAGLTWNDVVEETLRRGLVPPVLTSYLMTSLGGTHSAAGFGSSSFRRGTQIDHCLALEIVHHSGEVVRCSADENAELFEHALGGYGQFGVITRVRHRLRKALPHTRTYFLRYDDIGALLADEARLSEEKRVDFIHSMISPCYQGNRVSNGRRSPLHTFLYPMNVTVEAESADAIDDDRVLADLQFGRHVYSEDLSTRDFNLLGRAEDKVASPRVANIFTDVLVPWPVLERLIRAVEAHIFPKIVNVDHMLLWPVAHQSAKRPMVRLPDDPLVMGFGVYSRVPNAFAQATVAVAQGFVDLAMKMGAKYYLTGSARLDAARLSAQFGDAWPPVREIKRRYDPKGLFNPGFFQWQGP
jgi:cytokinin dehydrogenase